MREIKFRCWEKNEKMLVPVLDICWQDKTVQMPALDGESIWGSHFEQVELMQFTGLKDKNGKEIYEGDIIRWFNSYNEAMVEVIEWETSKAAFYIPGRGYPKNSEIEIIGNIFENPELLEESK